MSRSYWLKFGSGNGASFSGLNPTFLIWSINGLTTVTPPSISEKPTSSGLYMFTAAATLPIVFTADGATSGLLNDQRYISGVVDPRDSVEEALGLGGPTLGGLGASFAAFNTNFGSSFSALGSTVTGIGNTLASIGTFYGNTASSFGTTSTDPATVFGYLKRIQENLEGNATYTKSTGKWQILTRGSSTLLIEKTLVNSSATSTKT